MNPVVQSSIVSPGVNAPIMRKSGFPYTLKVSKHNPDAAPTKKTKLRPVSKLTAAQIDALLQ